MGWTISISKLLVSALETHRRPRIDVYVVFESIRNTAIVQIARLLSGHGLGRAYRQCVCGDRYDVGLIGAVIEQQQLHSADKGDSCCLNT